jgi:fructose-bisphosphate aldolase class II
MFQDARSRGYALGSFNVVSLEMAYGVIDAAEELHSPVIVAVTDGHRDFFRFEALASGIAAAAATATIPVGLHFDHGLTLASVSRALKAGFTSVMYDGDGSPWQQRLAETQVVTELAHGVGALVEGALSAQSREMTGNPTGDWALPPDDLVAEFLGAAKVDILAIGEGTSELDPARVSAIAGHPGVFTALHGGSALTDETLGSMIGAGLAKCSVFSKIARESMASAAGYVGDGGQNVLELGTAIRQGFARGVAAELRRMRSTGHA